MSHHDDRAGDEPRSGDPARIGDDEAAHDATKPDGVADDRARRDMQQGDRTKPAMPDGTTPLERGERPINQSR